jgi:hypothetical protein
VPQPTQQQLHVDRYLTNMAIMWSQDQSNFVADKIFPVVPVMKESDLYAVYQKGYFYRDEMQPRPLGGRPPEAGYEIENKRYSCVEWALEDKIDDRIRANADQPLDPDLASMRLLTGQALIHRERLWQEQFFKVGIWSEDWTGSATGSEAALAPEKKFVQFDATSGSEPISFIETQRLAMASKTGYQPNVLVLGANVFKAIKNHPAVLDRIKYTQRGLVTTDLLAAMFDVDRVVVPMGVINSAAEGQADSIDFIVSRKSMMLVYAAPAPSIQTPSAGYTFAYTGLIPGVTNAFGGVLERGREELAHSDVIQIRAAYDQRATATELGLFFASAVAV